MNAELPAPTVDACISAEAALLDRTRRECYAATASAFLANVRHWPIHQPRADLDAIESGIARPEWPGGCPFAVCLTHDVDNVAWDNAKMHVRRAVAQIRHLLGRPLERRSWGGLKSAVYWATRAAMPPRRPDSLHCYERWLDLESAVGARSTFYFLPDSYARPHFSDGGYRYQDRIVFDGKRCTVVEMMREIHNRGWEIGLHASWYASCSVAEMKREKEQLERSARTEVVSVRQHFLHCDIRHSPWIYQQAGLRNDSSMGFNDVVGFRHATCWPYELNDHKTGKSTGVMELPLTIQDRCLTGRGGKIDVPRAVERGMALAGHVEAVGGLLTILWHPKLIANYASMEVYVSLLETLRRRGAWFGTAREIADWWRVHRRRAEADDNVAA